MDTYGAKGRELDPFAVRGKLHVQDAAVVLCVRQQSGPKKTEWLMPADCGLGRPPCAACAR